mgnify:FL=1
MRVLGIALLVGVSIVVALMAAGDGDRGRNAAGTAHEHGHVPAPSLQAPDRIDSGPIGIAERLALLRGYRRSGQNELASELVNALSADLRPEDGPVVLDLSHVFVGAVCDCDGEMRYYSDRTHLARELLRGSPDLVSSGLEGLLPAFDRGTPEEHGAFPADSPLHHAECAAVARLLPTIEPGLNEATARRLAFSRWTQECGVIRAALLRTLLARFPALTLEITRAFLEAAQTLGEEHFDVLYTHCAALLKEGRTADVLALLDHHKQTNMLGPILHAIASELPLDEARALLGVVRAHLEGSVTHSGGYQLAIAGAHAQLVRRGVVERGEEDCLRWLSSVLEGSLSERGYDAVFSGVCDGSSEHTLATGRHLFEGRSANHGTHEARLAELAVRLYTRDRVAIPTDALNALAAIASDGGIVARAVSEAADGGNANAILDGVLALRRAAHRGLFREGEALRAARDAAKGLADRVQSYWEIRQWLSLCLDLRLRVDKALVALRVRIEREVEREGATGMWAELLAMVGELEKQ